MQQIQLSIGDWSDDGHGYCDHYVYEHNKTTEHLRELHFAFKEKYGWDIGDMCREYEVCTLTQEQVDSLTQIIGYDNIGFVEEHNMETSGLAELWMKLLKVMDDTLEYKKVEDAGLPTMHFYGFDKKKRHLKTPGYGCFWA